MSEEYPELSEYLKNLQSEIQSGITEDFYLKGDIEIELAIVKTKIAGGKLKILVAEAGGNFEKETISTIKFKIAKKDTGGTIIVSR